MDILSVKDSYRTGLLLVAMASCAVATQFAHALGQNDRFTNIGSIANTRHNMTQNTAGAVSRNMDRYRNEYGEVCVYCHTPHGGQGAGQKMPLWNRTIKATSYQTYNQLGTTSFSVDSSAIMMPGPASLTCLSCHDGQTAIDSIINMPGSGSAGATGAQIQAQLTSQSTAFLNAWNTNMGGGGITEATLHQGLNSTNGVQGNGTGSDSLGCLVCHSETGSLGGGLVDFTILNLGTDLRNDHPIGVAYPALTSPVEDWNQPQNAQGTSRYFQRVANGRMDKDEIRTYDGKVECASCHDPHGVPSGGPGTQTVFNQTFLRVQNTGSAVCLTCHNK